MIIGRITTKAQTTVPRAVRLALDLEPGDDVVWQIDGDRVFMKRVKPPADPFDHPFAAFTEWSEKADCEAFDNF